MNWYIWALIIWAGILSFFQVKAIFSKSNIKELLSNLNELIGGVATIILFFIVYEIILKNTPNALISCMIILSVSFVITFIEATLEYFSSVKINSKLKDGEESDNPIPSITVATVIVLLIPNFVAFYLGIVGIFN